MLVPIALAMVSAAFLPAVESPVPAQIGLDFPFTISGAFVVLAELRFAHAAPRRRERGVYLAAIGGIVAGAVLYATALTAQLL